MTSEKIARAFARGWAFAKGDSMSSKKPYILCVGATGRAVIFGWCDNDPKPGENIRIHDARMVLYWPSGGLLGLAAGGPREGTRLTASVPWTEPGPVAQVLAVTDAAAEALSTWPAA